MVAKVGRDLFLVSLTEEIKEFSREQRKNLLIEEEVIKKVFTQQEIDEFIRNGWLIPV